MAIALSLLLLGLMYQFLVPALKISNRTSLRAEVQQQATLALRNMVSEIEQSTLFGTSFSADGRVVAVHVIEEVTQNSDRVYADHLVVYQYDPVNKEIRRGLWRKGDEPTRDSPRKLSPDEMANIQANIVGPERVVVRRVKDFTFSHSGSGELIQLPLIAHLSMDESGQYGSRKFELVRTVSLRNR